VFLCAQITENLIVQAQLNKFKNCIKFRMQISKAYKLSTWSTLCRTTCCTLSSTCLWPSDW